ncbi:MAG: ABC transporter permease [Anaerolinea sp.]|nr:ABC transporter permease [Anaerolinea sp.]
MRMLVFASRNSKELLREPATLAFGVGFPLVVLLLLSAIQSNIPISLFEIESLSPGIAVFGLSFFSLFAGMLIAKDRTTSFLMRLFASPLTASDFILGYIAPLLPMAVAQSIVCFIAAFFLGLTVSANVLLAILVLLPTAALFIGIGLLAGSVLTDKQVGGVCGALLTNVSAWLSGTWFDLNLVGSGFKSVAYVLPFAHAVDATRAALAGEYPSILPHLVWVIGYAVLILVVAIAVFSARMKSDSQ